MAAKDIHKSSDSWTTRRLLAWTGGHLEEKKVDSPKLAAEMLLAHVLGVPRIKLYMDPDRPASPLERAAYRDLIERAVRHEPVQYMLGVAWFFSMDFKVTPDVLIPRPSTETLVEHVIQHARLTPGFTNAAVADIGTGSGCVAVAIAKHLPGSRVVATDISPAALAIAQENARKHGVADRIEFREGSLYEPLAGQRFSFICSNPPYIPDEEWDAVAANVKDYEPTGALRGGADGLDCLRPLINQASHYLADPGQIAFEIAASRKMAVLGLAEAAGLAHAHVLADHEGLARVLIADRR